MNAQIEDVSNVVRSCLLTSKNGLTINKLHQDYRSLEDRSIPYVALGFPTLEAFVQRIPGVRMIRRGPELWVEAIPTKESAHIARLVAGQRQSGPRRRPQRSRHVAPRRPQTMFRGMRSFDSNQARNRSWNPSPSYNHGSSNNMTPSTNYVVRTLQTTLPPLMAVPMTPPSRPRYTGATNTPTASPSKRMLDRNIQPHQHLDYERNSRPATRATTPVNKPKTTSNEAIPQLPRSIKNQQPAEPEAPLTPPVTPNSGVTRLPASSTMKPAAAFAPPTLGPVSPAPAATPWPTQQPIARTRLCDRLVISQTPSPFNSTVTNGNSGIQVTFKNIGAGGDGPLTPVSPSQDPRDDLKKLLHDLNLQEPEYKTRPVVGKKGFQSGFYGQVLVGKSKFSSYPEEAKSEKDAEILAARQAIVELMKEHSAKFRLRKTSDKALIKERVIAIVDQHNGVFTHKIPAYYQELHNENLPENWLDDAVKWSEMQTDTGVDDSKILRRRIICSDELPAVPSPKVDKVLIPPRPMGPVKPGKLELPEEHYWVAYVTIVISSVEIWVRLVGENYSEKFEELTSEMIQHYTTANCPVPETVQVGEYYALKEGECWHRVRVTDVDMAEGEAEVFFIDIGDEDVVSTSMLVPLEKKFCLLSAQAVKVALASLEDFADCDSVQPRIEKILLDGVFYVEDLSRETEDEATTVVFYDTNGPEDINVNEMITKKIIQQLITDYPKLETEGHVKEVHISHVDNNGDIFIQVKNEGMTFLVKMLNRLTQNGLTAEDLKKSAIQTIDRSKVYFARCPETGDWYRAKIIEESEAPRGLKMFLIDFGRTMIVDTKNVLQLDVLSQFLAKYPAQAMKVRLHKVEQLTFDEKMVARLLEIAPPSELLLLKVIIPSHRGSPPTVQLHKRNSVDDLVDVNETLVPPKISQTNGDGNNNVRPRRRVERTNSRVSSGADEGAKALNPPVISGINEYFDVHVTMAANPGNFTVQPHVMTTPLAKMMTQLKEEYKDDLGPRLSLDSVKEGQLYAAKHVDGDWYRVFVTNVINDHMITVYFCDYGDVTVIPLDKLQRLHSKFLELPYLAIKARLVGIKPTNRDWSVDDVVRFHNLVVDRDFVSVVVESTSDKYSPSETILGLRLIDTSTDDDVYVGKLLVDEGRAKYTD